MGNEMCHVPQESNYNFVKYSVYMSTYVYILSEKGHPVKQTPMCWPVQTERMFSYVFTRM